MIRNLLLKSAFALPLAVFAQQQQIPLPQSATPVAPVAELPPDTIVVTVAGKGYTAKQITDMLGGLPPQALAQVSQNPQPAMESLFLIRKLSDEALAAKLDKESPHKEAIEATTRQYLANAMVQEHNNKVVVSPAEQEAYYEKNKDRYETASISVIYISYSNNPAPPTDPKAKKPLTEAEAKAKAEKLSAELKAGADFAKLAQENSDDKESAAKGGAYATIKRSENFPPAIKEAVFKLEAGQVSEPVRQANGFYILKRTAKNVQPYVEVRDQLFQQLKNEKFTTWMQDLRKNNAVKIEKPEFFSPKR
jgi:parvulin-like peptidyl-prolyl isomerase